MTKGKAVEGAKKPITRKKSVRKTASSNAMIPKPVDHKAVGGKGIRSGTIVRRMVPSDETPSVIVTIADLVANPPRFTTAQRARLDAMSQDEIDAKADADPVNPTWSDEDLRRAAFAGRVREARARTGLSQPLFAERFHIAVSRLRDWERGRFKPDSVADAYITTILANPKAVERALTSNRGA